MSASEVHRFHRRPVKVDGFFLFQTITGAKVRFFVFLFLLHSLAFPHFLNAQQVMKAAVFHFSVEQTYIIRPKNYWREVIFLSVLKKMYMKFFLSFFSYFFLSILIYICLYSYFSLSILFYFIRYSCLYFSILKKVCIKKKKLCLPPVTGRITYICLSGYNLSSYDATNSDGNIHYLLVQIKVTKQQTKSIRIWINPRIWRNRKFQSRLRSLRSLCKNNKPNSKYTIKLTNWEFEQTQKSRTEWAPFAL